MQLPALRSYVVLVFDCLRDCAPNLHSTGYYGCQTLPKQERSVRGRLRRRFKMEPMGKKAIALVDRSDLASREAGSYRR